MNVAVITDSASCLPEDLIAASGVDVVPIQVSIDGVRHYDGVDVSSAVIAQAMTDGRQITTSKPTPAQFLDAYEAAAQRGATAVVSVHLSAALSGTVDSAHLAARDSSIPVTVVDSKSIGMGLGYAAVAAAETAQTGANAEHVAQLASTVGTASSVIFCVDTLEYLRRGGRIGKASAWLGGALRIKPLLHVAHGEIAPLEKARTSAKALSRLAELTISAAGHREVRVAVQHLDAQERARAVADRLSQSLGVDVVVCELSAVMGVHSGPGTVSAVVAPRGSA